LIHPRHAAGNVFELAIVEFFHLETVVF